MPETQRTERDETLQKILAPYDSAEQMTLGQLKTLGALGLSLIPADAPKGFAQELIDGKFNRFVAGAIAEARRDWRILHSRLQEEALFLVRATPGGTLAQYLSWRRRPSEDAPPIIYDGSPSYMYSVWGENYPLTSSKGLMCCRATGDIDQSRLVEALGGKESCAKNYKTGGTFESLYVTPQQAVAVLDSADLAQPEWREKGYSFLIGQTHDGCPLFIFAGRRRKDNRWHIREWPMTNSGTITQGSRVVFGKPLFLGV